MLKTQEGVLGEHNLGKGSTMLESLLPIRDLVLVCELLGSRGLRACLPEAARSLRVRIFLCPS